MSASMQVEAEYQKMYERGTTSKQDVDQHELIKMIMRDGYKKNGKIWWFAYELMGHWEIDGGKYFMSYKASSRVCEIAKNGEIETRPTKGKLCVYALKEVMEKAY